MLKTQILLSVGNVVDLDQEAILNLISERDYTSVKTKGKSGVEGG